MQKIFTRMIFMVIPFAIIFSLTGCGGGSDSANRKLDSLRTVLKMSDEQLAIAKRGVRLLKPNKKSKPVNVKPKPHPRRVDICVRATFNPPQAVQYDSVVLDIFIVKNGTTTHFSHLTLSAQGLQSGAVHLVEKDEFDFVFTTNHYKDLRAPVEGNWCTDGDSNCTIVPGSRCSTSSTPVATVQSTTTGVNTTTVSIEEQ